MSYRVSASSALTHRSMLALTYIFLLSFLCLVRRTKIATSATKFSDSSWDETRKMAKCREEKNNRQKTGANGGGKKKQKLEQSSPLLLFVLLLLDVQWDWERSCDSGCCWTTLAVAIPVSVASHWNKSLCEKGPTSSSSSLLSLTW